MPVAEKRQEVPREVLSSPALLFLYYRIEQLLGIKAGAEALINLNDFIEKTCGASFVEDSAAFERILCSHKYIYEISKFITINETYFFREGEHFKFLSDLLPYLSSLNRTIRICCAAVSIGCEAYSIAMLLEYHKRNGVLLDYAIDAFDINKEALDTAKNARYTSNTLRSDTSSWKYILDSYLIKDNSVTPEEYIVSKDICNKVNFFCHNIMRPLEKSYDIIFFRNTLIYFSSKNRLAVLKNLCDALNTGGFFFSGISETSSVNHPLLSMKYSSNVFYFLKNESPILSLENDTRYSSRTNKKSTASKSSASKPSSSRTAKPKTERQSNLYVFCREISDILDTLEGKPNAQIVLNTFENGNIESVSGSRLAASVIYFLNTQDFINADKLLHYLEKYNSGAYVNFLRGEYYFLCGILKEAEKYYQQAAIKDKSFWPAFYRIAILASDGSSMLFEYKMKKTIESIELAKNSEPDHEHYFECFLGGFSSDYFIRILEKKLK
jgi:chemotaxis protein methyltransferase CheR